MMRASIEKALVSVNQAASNDWLRSYENESYRRTVAKEFLLYMEYAEFTQRGTGGKGEGGQEAG